MTTMDLLDEFAKAALTGIMTRRDVPSGWTHEDTARSCYEIAEAMVAERERMIERRRQSTRGSLAGPTQAQAQAQARNRCMGLDPDHPNEE